MHVVVTAVKDHSGRKSLVALHQPVVIFVRPDADPGLDLMANVSAGRVETLLVSGGQPGVSYYFRRGSRGVEYPAGAHFHQRDDGGNRGVDRLRLGVDFAIARGAGGVGPAPDPLLIVPRPGKLDATWHVRAVRALTEIDTSLAKTARSWTLPEIVPEAAEVAPGTRARIIVRASARGERYGLYRGGIPAGDAEFGDGRDLVLVTEPLTADARFEVGASRPEDPGIPVERRMSILVEVTTPVGVR
jgi:hypothetical protein